MIATRTPDTTQTALVAQGFSMRPWRENADYEKMSRVLIASRNADGLPEARTGSDVQNMYERTRNFEATRNLLLVERNGETVGNAGSRWWQESDSNFVHSHWIYLLPEYRGRGIELELLVRTQSVLRDTVAEHTQGVANWIEAYLSDKQNWIGDLLLADGYVAVRYYYDMVCPNLEQIPDAELPDGIETRPVKTEHLRRIWDAEGEAFRENWGEAVEDEGDYQAWLKDSRMNPDLWQVAWDGDEIVGMVLSYVLENENKRYGYKRGYTENISVRKPWRGRGIAKALLVKSMKMFRDMGFDHTALGVDAGNATGALHLYESVGYQTAHRMLMYRRRL